jgi:hypothetical protein
VEEEVFTWSVGREDTSVVKQRGQTSPVAEGSGGRKLTVVSSCLGNQSSVSHPVVELEPVI